MAKQILFDNASITSGSYRVSQIYDENSDSVQINMFDLARQRGSYLLNKEYKPKRISVEGTILGSNNSDLESNIDDLKELLSRQGKNLDITYSSGTRRFVATCTSFKVDRNYFHLTYAPYKAEFIIPAGVGYDTSETESTTNGITDLARISDISILGTVIPKMRITITVTAATAITGFELLANGDKMEITNNLTAGDIVIIDERFLKVTLNGVEIVYTGIFPMFIIGANIYNLTFSGTSIEYDLTFSYTKTYL